jgi:alpha-beta hydrolase superfamily lysophospholipase
MSPTRPSSGYPALAPLHPSVPAEDGLVLRGQLVYPHGKAGTRYPLAVLAHQFPATRDSFAPLVTDLLALGVATLAFDLRGHGESIRAPGGMRVAPQPAEPTMEAFGKAFMASAGAVGFPHIADDIVRMASWGLFQNYIDPTRLLLVGGSVGGTGVLLAMPRLAPALRGVITVGAAGAGVHSADAMDRIRANCRTVTAPMFLASSENDPFDGANNIRQWSAGLAHIESKIIPGADHAMAIYYAVRTELLAFAKRVMVGGARAKTAPRKQGRRR